MLSSDFIKVYDNALSDERCDQLLEIFKQQSDERLTWVGKTGAGFSPSFKLSHDGQPDIDHPVWTETRQFFDELRERYFKDCSLNLEETGKWWSRTPFFAHYPRGLGMFQEHHDLNAKFFHRRWVVIVYLNTVDEGGETCFPTQGIKVKPIKGRALVFPPFWMFPHSANIPISHDKYIVTTMHSRVDEAHDAE